MTREQAFALGFAGGHRLAQLAIEFDRVVRRTMHTKLRSLLNTGYAHAAELLSDEYGGGNPIIVPMVHP